MQGPGWSVDRSFVKSLNSSSVPRRRLGRPWIGRGQTECGPVFYGARNDQEVGVVECIEDSCP
jgi:hypothetical protein